MSNKRLLNDGYIKKSDVIAALWELRKKYRRSEEKCAVGGCILKIRELPTVDIVEGISCEHIGCLRRAGIEVSEDGRN